MGKGKKATDNDSKELVKRNPIIDDEDWLVITTKIMRMPVTEALAYLEVHEHQMDRATYFRRLEKITSKIDIRAMEIARVGILERHMKMIDTLETCERLLWEKHNLLAGKPSAQAKAIVAIIEMQPYLTEAYNKTRVVMEKQAEMRAKVLVEAK